MAQFWNITPIIFTDFILIILWFLILLFNIFPTTFSLFLLQLHSLQLSCKMPNIVKAL